MNSKNRIGAKSKNRLQELLGDQLANWEGLFNEIENECNDDEIDLKFRGRKIDYEDLQETLKYYAGDVKFHLSCEEMKNDDDLLKELDKIFEEIKRKNIKEFKKKNRDGNDIFEIYENVKNSLFEVSVIATMSSGKSTLINALLQQELLPSENKACTAQITRIIDHDGMKKFEGVCYGGDNKTIIYPKSEITLDKMRKYNEDEKVKYIDLKGNIPGIPSDKIRLCLRDTPGPNNSQDEEHRKLTNSVIKRKNSIVLYVMNVTQMRIDDDKNLLKSIAQEMNLGGKEARDRFIFVLNKCDALDEEKGETVGQKINEAKDYLKEFEIVDPMIIPTNAQLALIIQKVRNGDKLTRKENLNYRDIEYYIEEKELHYEDYAIVHQDVKDEIKKQLTKYKKENDKESIALTHTGIPIIKELIRRYTL